MENYNEGGEGVAYHDADSANQAVSTARTADIDTVSNALTFALGWLVAGEWAHYVVNSTVLDTLTIYFRAACGGDGNGAFHLEIDGSPVSSSIIVQNTGSWTTYKTMTAKVSGLIPGSHVLNFVVDSSYFNIDWIQFGGESPTGLARPAALPATALRTYKVFSVTGRYLGSVNAREYADLRAAVMKNSRRPGCMWWSMFPNGKVLPEIRNKSVGLNFSLKLKRSGARASGFRFCSKRQIPRFSVCFQNLWKFTLKIRRI